MDASESILLALMFVVGEKNLTWGASPEFKDKEVEYKGNGNGNGEQDIDKGFNTEGRLKRARGIARAQSRDNESEETRCAKLPINS